MVYARGFLFMLHLHIKKHYKASAWLHDATTQHVTIQHTTTQEQAAEQVEQVASRKSQVAAAAAAEVRGRSELMGRLW